MAKAGRHIEVERKFAVPESGRSPSFDDLSDVTRVEAMPTQSLEAVYFDTDRHDLASNRITLRRRSGGSDAGWHLKLPSGGNAEARTEVRAPLGPDLPEELCDTVLAIVRDRPVHQVARISTARDVTVLYGADGAALAEFCDDQVTGSRLIDGEASAPQQWREWELELVDGTGEDAVSTLDRLAQCLLDAGAQPAGHASKLAKVLGPAGPASGAVPDDPVHRAVSEQIDQLREWDRAVRSDADDAVHQMRVTTRQIRSLLQASEGSFGLDDDAPILNELRELAGVLGIARDAEVLEQRYRDAIDAVAPELVRGPVAERLIGGARRSYEQGLDRSLATMRSTRYFRLLDDLDTLVASTPPPPDSGQPEVGIESSYHRVHKKIKALDKAGAEHERDEALHRIRKATKRLRYVAAATGESKVVTRAKAIQSLLGDHQDSVVSRAHLLDVADAAHAAGEDTFTYGLLYQREEELAQRCRDELGDALKKLRRSVKAAT